MSYPIGSPRDGVLVGVINTGGTFDLVATGLGVEILKIPLFVHFSRGIYEDIHIMSLPDHITNIVARRPARADRGANGDTDVANNL